MNVSCARSSASSRSRTMRKMSEKTGRSYRRISRNAASRPCWASATTSASGRLRSRGGRHEACGLGALHQGAPRRRGRKVSGRPVRIQRSRCLPLRCATGTFPRTHDLSRPGYRRGTSGGHSRRGGRGRGVGEARLRAAHFFADRAAYDLLNHPPQPQHRPAWRPKALAALEWRRTPRGHLPRSVRRDARRVGQARVAGGVSRASDRRRLRRADAARRAGQAARTCSCARRCRRARRFRSLRCSIAGAIVAFGIRNVADLDAGLRGSPPRARPGGALRDSRVLDAALGARPRRSITRISITSCRGSAGW